MALPALDTPAAMQSLQLPQSAAPDAAASGGVAMPTATTMPVRLNAPPGLDGCPVAMLVAPGIDAAQVEAIQLQLRRAGAHVDLVAPSLRAIETPRGSTLMPDGTFGNHCPLGYRAVVVPGGDLAVLRSDGAAVAFVARAYLHDTPIALIAEGADLLRGVPLPDAPEDGAACCNNVVRASAACAGLVPALAGLVAARAPGSPSTTGTSFGA